MTNNYSPNRKTVFITGCSSGIGRATAKLFHQQGWNVAATLRDPSKEGELHHLPNMICPQLDVNDTSTIESAITQTIDAFGSIDVVINNAGYALMGAFETVSPQQIQRQFDTNVFGLMAVCRAILPHFRHKKQGTLINIASMVGRIPLPLYSVYNASKFAVEGFTEGLLYEVEDYNIRVKLIEPGAVDTHFFGRSSDRHNATGETAYDDYSAKQFAVMDGIGAAGTNSTNAAHVIWNAATDGKKKLRYAVGTDAKALFLARRLLPDSIFNATIKLSLSPAAFRTVGKLLYPPKA